MATARERLHEMIDDLRDDQVQTVLTFTEAVRKGGSVIPAGEESRSADELAADPMLRVLMEAPEDDEPLTEAEHIAISEGKDDLTRGRVVSASDAKRRFGIS